MKQAILALEDGTIFNGYNFGAQGEVVGEVVFNTSMTGYQEILTDPSYAGQMVTMTYPLIGNYGINSNDVESRKPFAQALIVKENSKYVSNWLAESSIDEYLQANNVIGLESIDTRSLTKHIRLAGAMKGVISTIDNNPQQLVDKARNSEGIVGRDLVKSVSSEKSFFWEDNDDYKYYVVVYDFGVKYNILRLLNKCGCRVEVVPAWTSAEEVLARNPDGILLSNGPGDPSAIHYAVKAIRDLLDRKPIFGICIGHQLLSLALGASTYKLKFGHHGGNQPVKNLMTGQVEITAQNHGFAVEEESLMNGKNLLSDVEVTHINLNDKTIEGINCLDIPAFSVQYHPEASPGPHDSRYLFSNFNQLMDKTGENTK